MSLFDSFKGFISKQFIDVIQWNESESGVLSYRYPMRDMEIQNGATLTVRESQIALFVNEGKIADVFAAGTYTLNTQNLPLLTNLKNWDKLFESPFKSDVYFFSAREQVNQTWGTATPISVRDKELGVIRLRANGTYSYAVHDAATFWTKLVGTLEKYTINDLEGQLRAAILTALSSFFGSNHDVAFLDMASNQMVFSQKLQEIVSTVFQNYGLQLKSFYVQSLSLPEEVQQHLDKVSSMKILGDMKNYTQFQAAESLTTSGGMASAGTGIAAGVAMGQMMVNSLGNAAASKDTSNSTDSLALLERLGEMLKKGLLTQAEFDAKKAEILKNL